MHAPDVVVLAPGFLGFARFGGFYYFADRVVAVVRALLEEACGRPVPVVPCTTLPTNSLAERQRFLLAYLDKLCGTTLTGVERIHLIGHSTGGVDVELLARSPALDEAPWSPADAAIRERLASVVTISAPHHGTGLATSRLARFGENPLRHPTAIVPLTETLVHLIGLLPREVVAATGFAVACPNDILRFLLQIIEHRELIGDLHPTHMTSVRQATSADLGVPVTCFVTGTAPRRDREHRSDPFFADLYEMTAAGSVELGSAAVTACARRLEDDLAHRRDLVIASPSSLVPERIDLAFNDAIVNTARQLVDARSMLGGIVVADHGDVLGHYDRRDALIEGKELNAGLFHSGASFGDDEFFTLYRRVAATILRTIPDAACASPDPRPDGSPPAHAESPLM